MSMLWKLWIKTVCLKQPDEKLSSINLRIKLLYVIGTALIKFYGWDGFLSARFTHDYIALFSLTDFYKQSHCET